MERTVPFTYLRLGDGELSLLISWQEGNIPQGVRNSGSLRPIFHAQGVTGIRLQDYPRILRAFEDCNYLVEQRARVLGFRVQLRTRRSIPYNLFCQVHGESAILWHRTRCNSVYRAPLRLCGL